MDKDRKKPKSGRDEPKKYKMEFLKGKKTGLVKCLIIIDGESEESPPKDLSLEKNEGRQERKQDEEIMEEKSRGRVSRGSKPKRRIKKFRDGPSQVMDIQEEMQKKKDDEYYDPNNYAEIPEIIPKNDPQYQTVLKAKKNGLKGRQYTIIE